MQRRKFFLSSLLGALGLTFGKAEAATDQPRRVAGSPFVFTSDDLDALWEQDNPPLFYLPEKNPRLDRAKRFAFLLGATYVHAKQKGRAVEVYTPDGCMEMRWRPSVEK